MKCQQCGAENQEQAKFCSECGERLSSTLEPPVPTDHNDAVDSEVKEKNILPV